MYLDILPLERLSLAGKAGQIDIRLCVLRFSLLCLASTAAISAETPLQNIEDWRSNRTYTLGDVVVDQGDIYVSIEPSRSKQPSSDPLIWTKANLSTQLDFELLKMYLPGQVVDHSGRYYLVRRASMLRQVEQLNDIERRWLPFPHADLIHQMPAEPAQHSAFDALLGMDRDDNGIRDDFEHEITASQLPAPVIESALDAGRIYGRVLSQTTSGVSGGQETVQLAIDWLRAEQCRRLLQQAHEGTTWPKSAYFNSLFRIEALFQISYAMAEVVNLNDLPIPKEDPCIAIAAFR